MRQLIWSLLGVLLLAPAAVAQPLAFSEPTPLTTMRYIPYYADARLLSNGSLPYLLWTEQNKTRITPITGVRRVGRPVLDASNADGVWTGAHFLIVGYDGRNVIGRRVGADGEAAGAPFTILADTTASITRLAFDGSRVLLVFGDHTGLRWVHLTRDGTPTAEPQIVPLESVQPVLSVELTARAGEFLLAVAGQHSVGTGSLRNTLWTTFIYPAADDLGREVTIAANATETLTIWTNRFAPLEARTTSTERPGQFTSYTLTDTTNATGVSASWDGKDFIYTYIVGIRLHSRYFNAPFSFSSTETAGGDDIHQVSVNGRTYGAWPGLGAAAPIIVRDVVSSVGDLAAFSAAAQHVETSTSSNASALFVWTESSVLHAGIRNSNGGWTEGQLPTTDTQAPIAASDGRDFVIVHFTLSDTSQFNGWSSTLLDADGRILGNGPRVTSFIPTDIAWTGTAYAVVGVSSSAQQVVAALLSPAGTITAPTAIAAARPQHTLVDVDVAVREGELLITWAETDLICPQPTPGCPGYQLLGTRASPELQRFDAQPLLLADSNAAYTDVIWDGTRYVLAWSAVEGTMRYRTLRTNSAISGITTVAGAKGYPALRVVNGSVVTTAFDGDVVFFRDGGDIVMKLGAGPDSVLERLGSRGAYVESMARDEAPYHGARRVHIRVGDVVAPAPKPSAPVITRAVFQAQDDAMIIEWTAPPEPVNGYRVEYRVDDSVWNELDLWFDSRATRLVIRPWRGNTVRYQFRVRAVNDAGFSRYSQTAAVRTRKMRAVN
ncbi:MAG TPA: fibronectin type III domain-containing protein [Thermoanaerobaculia bacterium]|nr:fibronectin type III domain-containing protein [Thermoanaerobaculia bacterium]